VKRRDIAALAVFVAIVLVFCLAVDKVTSASDGAELKLVRDAVKNAALTCYAVEGAYPEDLEYLREHYQLAYDEERFLVTYIPFAPNVIPTIYITQRGATLK